MFGITCCSLFIPFLGLLTVTKIRGLLWSRRQTIHAMQELVVAIYSFFSHGLLDRLHEAGLSATLFLMLSSIAGGFGDSFRPVHCLMVAWMAVAFVPLASHRLVKSW